ncbi:hypothetical protein MASR2M66_30240 [Chloroflexota bacterium]
MIPRKYASIHKQARPEAETWAKFFVLLSIVCWSLTPVIGLKNAIIILALAGFFLAVIGLRKPSLGLIGISVLCTLDPMTRALLLTGGLFRWNTLNYWLLLVIVFSFSLLVRLNNPQIRLLTLFLIIMGIGLLVSQSFEYGLQHMLAILITFGILAYFIRAIRDPGAWYWSAVVCGWVAGLGGFVYFTQPSSTYINPNAWSFFPLTAIISACLAVHLISDQKRKLFSLYILIAVNVVWVFLSGSRGDLIISFVCIVVLLIASKSVSTRVLFLFVGVLAVFIISNEFDILRQNALKRIIRTFDSNYSILNRTSGRSDLIIGGWNIFLENPMGVGTGGFAPAWAEFGSMNGEISFRLGSEFQAHSGWIKVMAENGIPGILLFGGFVLSFVITGWRKKSFPTIGLLVTSCLTVALMTTEFQGKGLWYLAAGGIVLINKQSISDHLANWEQTPRNLGRSLRYEKFDKHG